MKSITKIIVAGIITTLAFSAVIAEAALSADIKTTKIPSGIRIMINSVSGLPTIVSSGGQAPITVTLYALYGESPNALNNKTTPATISKIPETIDVNIAFNPLQNNYFRIYYKPNNCPTPAVCTNPNTSDGFFPHSISGEPYTFMIPGVSSSAQGSGVGSSSNVGIGSSTNQTDTTAPVLLKDPLNGKFPNIPAFLKALFDVIIVVAIPIVAIMIIWSGFLIVSARGNEEQLTKGKKAFFAAVIGGVLVLGAYVIAQAIETTVKQITE